jgi:membrane-bound lytic murein transglycosylase A
MTLKKTLVLSTAATGLGPTYPPRPHVATNHIGSHLKKNLRFYTLFFTMAALMGLIQGCAAVKSPTISGPGSALERLSLHKYPDFNDDAAYDGLNHAIAQSLNYLNKLPGQRAFIFGKDTYSAKHLIKSLTLMQNMLSTKPTAKQMNTYIREKYRVYKSKGTGSNHDVLFTGYFEPLLLASLTKTDQFRYPVYGRPLDHVTVDLGLFSSDLKGRKITGRHTGKTLVPYYDRQTIKAGLPKKIKPLAWVADRIGLFFLHIQGSGRIYLPDGQMLRVNYEATNGQPYRSIGKLLIEQGKIERKKMSMQAIRTYLKKHPQEVNGILNHNPSYVFLKISDDGPFGALGVIVTPSRSIALDRRVFPLSGLAFVKTKTPLSDTKGQIIEWIDFNRFVLAQDTGGAIRGPGRADLFWGSGPYAEIAAGHMQHRGSLYFLVLKPKEQSG